MSASVGVRSTEHHHRGRASPPVRCADTGRPRVRRSASGVRDPSNSRILDLAPPGATDRPSGRSCDPVCPVHACGDDGSALRRDRLRRTPVPAATGHRGHRSAGRSSHGTLNGATPREGEHQPFVRAAARATARARREGEGLGGPGAAGGAPSGRPGLRASGTLRLVATTQPRALHTYAPCTHCTLTRAGATPKPAPRGPGRPPPRRRPASAVKQASSGAEAPVPEAARFLPFKPSGCSAGPRNRSRRHAGR
jgi:hypothetical protein